MASAKCAVCNKTAYPMESVTALEKQYHKACFRCYTCKLLLNPKNFKGYQGNIYCFTHTPKPSATTVNLSKAKDQKVVPVSDLVASILEKIDHPDNIFSRHGDLTQQQFTELVQEAERGNINAQFLVGFMYESGYGVQEDPPKGLEFLLSAADKGHMLAQSKIGYMLETGTGMQKDLTKAFEYQLKSANQGCHYAQYYIGLFYKYGKAIAQDYRKAFEYFQMAAAHDYPEAFFELGYLYHCGSGVLQNYHKALEYYLKATITSECANNIGVLYENGHAVTQSYWKALEYYQIAAKTGYTDANDSVERVRGKIANTEYWTVDEVCSWLATLNLSQNYQALIQDNYITGKALISMKKEDWKELGVTRFGDLHILVNTPNLAGRNLASAPVPPPTATESGPSRYSQNEGLDDVLYKPIIQFLEGDYKPPLSCNDHMVKDLPFVLLAVRNVPAIVEDCVLVAESRLQNLPSNVPTLSNDEALAIAAYSYDLSVQEVEKNLYHALNVILRKRDPKKMEKLKPFLFFLMSGLSKLPPLQTTVYRGIPFSSMKMVQDNYRPGGTVHWSGFTSASTDIESAKIFAQESGILFRIKVFTGRSIKHYSSIPSEDEVLLSPNTKLLVSSGVEKESDGFFYLDLVEQVDGKSFVF